MKSFIWIAQSAYTGVTINFTVTTTVIITTMMHFAMHQQTQRQIWVIRTVVLKPPQS